MPELGAVIAEFLHDVERGAQTRDEVRELRRDLTHVASQLGPVQVDAVRGRHVEALVDELRESGLPPERVRSSLEALRTVYAYAIGRGLVRTSPLVGRALPATEGRSPTTAVLALGEQAVAWTVRVIVIAFVLIALGLVVALA
jgi:site-specific recombinase XerD